MFALSFGFFLFYLKFLFEITNFGAGTFAYSISGDGLSIYIQLLSWSSYSDELGMDSKF